MVAILYFTTLLFLSKHLHPFFQRLYLLLAGGGEWHAERHLGDEFPLLGQVPGTAHFLVDERVVVLEGSPEAQILEQGPNDKLVYGRGVLGPSLEIMAIERVGLHELAYYRGILEEQYRSVSAPETGVYLLFRLCENLFRQHHLQNLLQI